MIRVILAGEGTNELGGYASEPAYRADKPVAGVLETLLRQVRPDGWQVVDAVPWKKTPKLQVGIGGKGEELNVQRAYHHAKKRGCDVFAFSRDRDHPKFAHREHEIEKAIESIVQANDGPAIVGGIAIEKIEAWILAIAGVLHSENVRYPEEKLLELEVRAKHTADMTQVIEQLGLKRLPEDAQSLRQWLGRAERALNQHPTQT